MGSTFSKITENTKKFFQEKTGSEIAYMAIAAPVLLAQLIYIQLNYKQLPALVPSKFGFDGNVIRSMGKWSLFILPATSLFLMVVGLAPKLKELASRANRLSPKSPAVSAALLSLTTLFLGYITFSQINIAKGKQSKIIPAITFSYLGAAVGLPLVDTIYHAVTKPKETPKTEGTTPKEDSKQKSQ